MNFMPAVMGSPDREASQAHLEKVLASRVLAGSRRLCAFLRWTGERVLNGEGDHIKEYQLGVEVFERGPDFDPRTEGIVRVEANRLRHKLREYYESEGQHDALRIELPKGRYAPVFHLVREASPGDAPAAKVFPRRWRWYGASTIVLTLLAAIVASIASRSVSGSKGPVEQAPGLNCIAVMPFSNLSGQEDAERLADGLAEELTNRLARFSELRVVARRSAFQFKGKSFDVQQIGKQLRVGSILEGSLRRNGDHLEISAEIVSTQDGYYLWSNHYSTSLDGLYGAEDEIIMGALRAIRITPKGGLEAVLHNSTPPLPGAHRLYLEGRYYWNIRTYEALQRAIELYEKALTLDPNYAQAQAGIAESYGVVAANGLADTAEAAAKGKAAARKAIALDSRVAEAYAALGLIQSVADWNWAGAEASFQSAIALNPNYANAHQWRAHNFLWQGRFKEARESIQKALDLDSLSMVILSNQAEFAYYMHDFPQALRLYDHTLEIDPNFISATIERGMVLVQLERYQEALASFEKARTLTAEEASPIVGLAIADAKIGKVSEARRILSELEVGRARLHVSNFQLAAIRAALGDIDAGIHMLEKAYGAHEGFLTAIKVHPDMDPLRGDPRFAELQKKMRLN